MSSVSLWLCFIIEFLSHKMLLKYSLFGYTKQALNIMTINGLQYFRKYIYKGSCLQTRNGSLMESSL